MFFSRQNPDEARLRNYSLLTTHYSPLTTHHSLLTTQHSPLTTHHSPLTTHLSPLPPHLTNNTLPCAAFTSSPTNWYVHVHTNPPVFCGIPFNVPSHPALTSEV